MGLHAVNAALHDLACLHAEHLEALLDDVTAALRGEALVLEFLLEALDRHAIEAFGAHERVGLHTIRIRVNNEPDLVTINLSR